MQGWHVPSLSLLASLVRRRDSTSLSTSSIHNYYPSTTDTRPFSHHPPPHFEKLQACSRPPRITPEQHSSAPTSRLQPTDRRSLICTVPNGTSDSFVQRRRRSNNLSAPALSGSDSSTFGRLDSITRHHGRLGRGTFGLGW